MIKQITDPFKVLGFDKIFHAEKSSNVLPTVQYPQGCVFTLSEEKRLFREDLRSTVTVRIINGHQHILTVNFTVSILF